MTGVVTDGPDCLNCGAALRGAYCSACGQKALAGDPTVRDLLHDVADEFLHWDSKVPRTLALLFTRPGFLAREAFAGRRTRYLKPLRLYLTFSIIYFSTAALLPPAAIVGEGQVEVGAFRVGGMTADQAVRAINDTKTVWLPRAMFMLVPVLAWLVWLATRRTGRTYIHSLYFALYLHAAYFGVMAVMTMVGGLRVRILDQTVTSLGYVALAGYTAVAFRTAYEGSWWVAVRQTLLVLWAYLLIVVAVVAAILISLLPPRT